MEPPKNLGIAVESVTLIESVVKMVNPEGTKKYHLALVNLRRIESPDGKKLTLFAAFDMMSGVEKPLFEFTCEFMVMYARQEDSSMAWKDFSDAVALAHIIPYLREYVSNTTNRLPTPILMLPPLNTHAMIEVYEARKRESSQATAAASSSSKPA